MPDGTAPAFHVDDGLADVVRGHAQIEEVKVLALQTPFYVYIFFPPF